MFNKHCFCDSNIPSSHGWLNLNILPRSVIFIKIRQSKVQAFFLFQILHCQNQLRFTKFLHSPRFRYRSYHIVGKFIGFWEERRLLWKLKGSRLGRCLNLATNISRIIRIARKGVWLSREPVRGRVQQKILCFMLNDCSQTERLWPVYAHF